MYRVLILSIWFLCQICCVSSYGKNHIEPQQDTIRILAIGNSFSADAVENYFFELAKTAGVTLVIGNAYLGGCTLERHMMNASDNKNVYEYRKISYEGRSQMKNVSLDFIIDNETWDFISLQQASALSGILETYQTWLPKLYDHVKSQTSHDSRFILHMTWAYANNSQRKCFENYDCNQLKMYQDIVKANKKALKLKKFKFIIPTGTAIQNLRTVIGDNVTRDGYHLNALGKFTAACTWFEKLFNGILQNSYMPSGLSEAEVKFAKQSAYFSVKHPYRITNLN